MQDLTKEQAFEIMLAGIKDVPRQLQFLVDTIVGLQETFPMPKESWQRFVRDIEYTNKKHGLNLIVPRYKEDES